MPRHPDYDAEATVVLAVRITKSMHRQLRMATATRDVTMRKYVERALRRELDRAKPPTTAREPEPE